MAVPDAVVYRIEDSRSAKAAEQVLGGFAGIRASVGDGMFAALGTAPPLYTLAYALTAASVLVEPLFYQRIFAARNPRAVRNAFLWGIVLWAAYDWATTAVGMAGGALMANGLLPADTPRDQVLLRVVPGYLPLGLAGFFLGGILATAMSTVDSYLLLAAGNLVYDIYRPLFDPNASPRRLVALTRTGVFVVMIAAALYLVLGACYLAVMPRERLGEHTPYNHYALLAESWLAGRLDLAGAVLDLFKVLYEPGAVFERLRDRPRILVPMVSIVVMTVIVGFLAKPYVEAALGTVMAQQSQGTPSPVNASTMATIQIVTSAVFMPIVILIGAGILWVAVSVFGAEASYRKLVSVQSHAMVLYVAQLVAGFVVLSMRGVESVTSPTDLQPAFGLDLLMPDAKGYLGAVLKGVNVFSVWSVFVQGIGITKTHNTSRETGYGAAAVAFVVALLVFSLFGLLQRN